MPDEGFSPSLPQAGLAFLAGESDMARLMRGFDWAATKLGPPQAWPQPLRTVVRLMLNTRHPMFVFWGPSHICLYNDAYAASIGPERHPGALGQPGRCVWEEIWGVIGPQIDLVMSGGGATWHEDELVPITRHNRLEDVYWTYSYSPIDDESAATGVGGVLVVCNETTQRIVAERRLADTALASQAERDRLASLFAAAPSFIAVLHGPQHRFELVNEAYLRLVGRSDLIGSTMADALPEVAAQGYLDLLDRVFRSGEPYRTRAARYVAQTLPGGAEEERFVDFVCQPIFDAAGAVSGIFVEGVDTTERTLAEAEHRQTAALLGAIIETAPGLIYAKDADGRMLIANSATLKLIGKGWADVQGRTDAEFLTDPEEARAVMANDRMVRERGQPVELEEVVSEPGGPPRMFISRKAVLRDANGTVNGLVGVSVDITTRKAMERELQSLNATLEARVAERTAERDRTWRNMQDLFVVVAVDGMIRAANPAWTTMLGWLPEEVIGRNHLELNHPDDHEASAAALLAAAEEPLPAYESRMLHKDGSFRDVAWVAAAEGGLVYASGRNITAERQAAAALARTEELLRQSQKMQAVGQLTGGIAHDFNNMLQSISSGVELMRRRIADGRPEEAERFVDITRQGIERASALTNRLLAFSRRQALAPARVNLDVLVPDIGALIAQTVGPAIDVRIELNDGCWPVRCDPNQLENALLNLAINARDAILPGSGTLTISTSHAVLDTQAVAGWDGAQPGAFVGITMADTGSGMTADVIAHAFEPFFTTKPAGHGTGLGLSQVFGFVSQSNGVLRLESTPGQGTTVSVFLPRHAGAPSADAPAAPGAAVSRGVTASVVLLVEDEADVRALAAQALRELGCQVLEARDGAAGLAMLRGAREVAGGRVDMLVSDVGLPGGLNGRQLADAARELLPSLPVLLITGFAGDALERNGDLAPGIGILGKPFTLDALSSRVAAALGGSR